MSLYEVRKTPGDTAWFRHDRFGMFIHFGLYALPARHEWVKLQERIPEDKYQKYFDHFNPDLFDAREWARQAKAAGMKYAILTTKHHEGFCLFDTQYTDYKITNTAFGRDLVREYVDALRAEGLRVGFYYSLIDWHHPDFPIDCYHPRRHDPDAEKLDAGRDMTKYAQYMRDQVTELLTNYGKIDILWMDYSYDPKSLGVTVQPWMQFGGGKGREQWEAEKLVATCRKLQPHLIINNRTELEQDLWTPEQYQPTEWATDDDGQRVTFEACQTFSGSWGYYRDEMSWKSPKMLVDMLVNTVAVGGNLIMNVGPTSRGCFDHRATAALQAYGDWMKYNSRSIYGCTMAQEGIVPQNGAVVTQSDDGKRLYIHLQTYPFGRVSVEGICGRVEYAQFLQDGSEIAYTEKVSDNSGGHVVEQTGKVFFTLPTIAPQGISPVIEVFLK